MWSGNFWEWERMSLIWRNAWCIILQFWFMDALSWVPCLRISYAWCMVGALIYIYCILLKMQSNNCHLPNTHQSPSRAGQIYVRNCLDLYQSPSRAHQIYVRNCLDCLPTKLLQYKSGAYLSFRVYSVANQEGPVYRTCYEYFLLTAPFYLTGFPVYFVAQPHSHYT